MGKDLICSPMGIVTQELILMENLMEVVSINGKVEAFTQETLVLE